MDIDYLVQLDTPYFVSLSTQYLVLIDILFNPHPVFQLGIGYYVRVLQQGAWPLSQTGLSPLKVPRELEKTVVSYEQFYGKQFSGRKLTWLHHLSNGDVKLGYLNKPYIVNMTTFQVRKR